MSRNNPENQSKIEIVRAMLPERMEVSLKDGEISLRGEYGHISISDIKPSGPIVLPAGTNIEIGLEGAIHLSASAKVEAEVELFFSENPHRGVRFSRFPVEIKKGAVLLPKNKAEE